MTLSVQFASFGKLATICPKALIAHTIKGKGVSFMESSNLWHYRRLDRQSFRSALDEISLSANLR